jgi:hypothetical protein
MLTQAYNMLLNNEPDIKNNTLLNETVLSFKVIYIGIYTLQPTGFLKSLIHL